MCRDRGKPLGVVPLGVGNLALLAKTTPHHTAAVTEKLHNSQSVNQSDEASSLMYMYIDLFVTAFIHIHVL